MQLLIRLHSEMRAHVSVGRCVNGRFHRNGIATPLIRKSFLVSCAPLDQSPLHTPMYFSHDHPSASTIISLALPPQLSSSFAIFSLSPDVLFIKLERRDRKVGLLCRINGRDLCIGRLDKMSDFWEKRLFHGCWSSFPCVDMC